MAASDGRLRPIGRRARRVVCGGVLVGAMLTGGVAIGLGDGANGRDGGTTPGQPTDEPAPFDDTDEGRRPVGPSKLPRSAGTTETFGASEPSAPSAPLDNGRGAVDPAAGPLAAVAVAGSAMPDPALAPGEFDTDSGLAPTGSAGVSPKQPGNATSSGGPAASSERTFVDQDVPGAPTGGPDGPDDPPNDTDG